MASVKALVLSGFGLNCDFETSHALNLAGAAAERVHINDLGGVSGRANGQKLGDYHILVFGGGFSWGDDHGAGVLLANRLARRLHFQLEDFLARGGLILGICNGFQALVNLGLLPGLKGERTRQAALLANDCGNFQDRWVRTKINSHSPCLFTRGLDYLSMPVRHGEGKLVAAPEILKQILDQNLFPLQYAGRQGAGADGLFPANPNGSLHDIAGLCSPDGRVFGLMPHPEAYYRQSQHPDYTLRRELARRKGEKLSHEDRGAGMLIFENAVKAARENF
ncbi:MAG: phosphoribosylformylglycinamidine synthase subunit PurQ [Desulfarculales bacterium]|jgi:phosphoribosylformylglycinamidine synthase|nr:phosphoribosylformylglycinamidine synthase subunit PurQ [Desulfarculales bacterium]